MVNKIDWKDAVGRAMDTPERWVLAGRHAPASLLVNVPKRRNRWLKEIEFDLMMPETVGTPARGDLYLRYHGPRIELRRPQDRDFHTIQVSEELKLLIEQYAEDNEVTISSIVEDALQHLISYGWVMPPKGTPTTLNVTVTNELWDGAMERAKQDGFPLAVAIRDEVAKVVRGTVHRMPASERS